MKFALCSLILYGLLVLTLGVSAAPILGTVDPRAESLDLSTRTDGFGEGGEMVRRRRLLNDHDASGAALVDDSPHNPSHHCNEVLKASADDLNVHGDVPHPVYDFEVPHLAKRGIKDFFGKVWGGVKAVAGTAIKLVLRRGVSEGELSERSRLCNREGESLQTGVKLRRLEQSSGQ